MWFKRVFFDWSVKVPMLIAQPGKRQEQRIDAPVSHVDILPTLLDYANPGQSPVWVEPIDGRSMKPLIDRSPEKEERSAFVEYTAEGVTGPCCMLRRGRYKYIYTHGYPDILYDLASDPQELRNLASELPGVVADLKGEVMARWKPAQIEAEVLASQARRKFINGLPDAMQPVWDYQAKADDTKRFVRRGSARIIKVKKRWPPLASMKS
jgi:choline-sulfatase